MNKPIHDAAHYAEILRTRATLERSRKKTKPRHGLARNFDDAAAYLDMVTETDETIRAMRERIGQLEGFVKYVSMDLEIPEEVRNMAKLRLPHGG